MNFVEVMNKLRAFPVPTGWPGALFQLPEGAMKEVFEAVVAGRFSSCIELGTGFGATTCVLAAALEANGSGRVVTVDMFRHEPVNVDVVSSHVGLRERIDIVVDPLGYNWYLADRIRRESESGTCKPVFDFCLLDGAHEFEPDALAFTLVAKLLKPGGALVVDDVNFHLRQIPNWRDSFGNRSDRELDTEQIRMVWELLVRQHPDFEDFRLRQDGRLGWARRRKQRFWGRSM